MRLRCVILAVGFFIVASSVAFAAAGETASHEKIAALIAQLGHDRFAERAAATKALEAIGEPALAAVKQAAKQGDPETRERAAMVAKKIQEQIRLTAISKELAKYQGDWEADGGFKLTIRGDRWRSSTPVIELIGGQITCVDVQEDRSLCEILLDEGSGKGSRCRVIFRRDGDTLHYCGTFGEKFPTKFEFEGENVYYCWKRVKPATSDKPRPVPAQPPK
jgi:hypothetical protein